MHTDVPLISIITPVFNGEKYIRECIESVLAQDYPNIEHIVVDDGSNDNTLSIIAGYPQVKLLLCGHKGATSARNSGLQAASGCYIKFLDTDDLLTPQAISLQQAASTRLDKKEIGYGYREAFYESGQASVIHKPSAECYPHPVVNRIFGNLAITLPLHSREALLAVGGFDERLKSGQEWNLHIRLARQGYKFVYQDILIFRHRYHDSSHRISNRKIDWKQELQNFDYSFEAIAGLHDPIVQDAWAGYLWGFGRRALREGNAEGAQLFFNRAVQISPKGYRRFLQWRYRLALTLLGPAATENLITKTRSFRN